ncbi:hypothetical protein F2Q69_00010490 [Brassica cretica]|uniref:J domain-containing protein n=1 Tax=Brassica cretica TaxID=69181 RepID=A0A8S9R9Y3_BRACR|nr:hypothetical protein F2Q69_00010490 [Brassica cretica]
MMMGMMMMMSPPRGSRSRGTKKSTPRKPKANGTANTAPRVGVQVSENVLALLFFTRLQYWHFDFCGVDDDDFDIDYVFRTAFGGPRGFSFSFTFEEDEPPRWHHRDHSSRFSNKSSWKSKHRIYEDEEEEDGYTSAESSDSDSEPNQASHRQALGLSPSGPLNLKDVKNAFRTCALKWHPDRHQGSTKEAAEAKFKLCSVAYESLCEKLAVN